MTASARVELPARHALAIVFQPRDLVASHVATAPLAIPLILAVSSHPSSILASSDVALMPAAWLAAAATSHNVCL